MLEPWKPLSSQIHGREEILNALSADHERSISDHFQGQSMAGSFIGGYFSRDVVERKTRDSMTNAFSEMLAEKFSEELTQEELDALSRLSDGQISRLCLELIMSIKTASRADINRFILWISPPN
jgi:hypothetical protein